MPLSSTCKATVWKDTLQAGQKRLLVGGDRERPRGSGSLPGESQVCIVQRRVIAQEGTLEMIWLLGSTLCFMIYDANHSLSGCSWKRAIMLLCFLLCSVAFVIRMKQWNFSSEHVRWMVALCCTTLTFSVFHRSNRSCLSAVSAASGKSKFTGKCRRRKKEK